MNIYLIPVIFFAYLQMAATAEIPQSSCSCALFDIAGDEPLIEHTLPFLVACDEKSTDTCRQLCIAVAQSVEDKANSMICEKLNGHIENLNVAVYTKSCGSDGWESTGLQSEKPINCHDGKEMIVTK